MGMSSDHYHPHKDVLCWDCNNLIKNIYVKAIVWGEIQTEKWIVYIWKDGNCDCILTHKTCLNFTWIK